MAVTKYAWATMRVGSRTVCLWAVCCDDCGAAARRRAFFPALRHGGADGNMIRTRERPDGRGCVSMRGVVLSACAGCACAAHASHSEESPN